MCRAWREAGEEPGVQARTGLLLDPYFSGTKIAWAMRNWPQLRGVGDRLAIGTVESWLVWKLTGGLHVTDATNASRTLLMGLGSGGWSDGLLDMFSAPRDALPEIVDCAGSFGTTKLFGGEIPICGTAGDQQAATIGQACLERGDTKATYGTGAFVLTNAGSAPPASKNRLRSPPCSGSWAGGAPMRSRARYSSPAAWSSGCATSVKHDRDGPGDRGAGALGGRTMAASTWLRPCPGSARPGGSRARAAISGLSFAATRAHIVRAALEAMAHQSHDLKAAFAADGADWSRLRIDGGMVTNDWIAQDLADILAIPVDRPDFAETTALGAAMLAGIGCGMFTDLGAARMRGAG